MKFNKLVLSSMLLVVFLLSIVARANASGSSCSPGDYRCEGEQLCKTAADANDALDPCNQAKIYKIGARAAKISTIAHTAAMATCIAESVVFIPFQACRAAGYAAIGADAVGIVWTIKESLAQDQSFTDALQTAAPSYVKVGAGLALAGSVMPGAAVPGLANLNPIGAANLGKTATYDKEGNMTSKGCFGAKTTWCAAAIHAVIAASTGYDIQKFGDKREEAYVAKARDMYDKSKLMRLEGEKDAQGLQKGTGDLGGIGGRPDGNHMRDPGGMASASPQSIEEEARELAATMTDSQRQLMKDFEKVTGGSSAALIKSMVSNSDPFRALGNAMQGTSGDPKLAEAMGSLAGLARDTAGKHHDMVTNAAGIKYAGMENMNSNFVSSGTGSTRKSAGAPMPDFGALLSGLMPQQPGPAQSKEQGAKGPSFTNSTPNRVDADGFHLAERSLFEIVDSRYKLVSERFLGGDAIVREPASMVPRNLYLGK